VLKNAFLNREGITWRDLDGNALAHLPLPSSTPGEFGGVLHFGQSRMGALILEELKKYPSVEVRFGLRCVGIEDLPSSSGVKVMARQRNLVDEDIIFEADYVLASDGANSGVRRMMCTPFEGFSFQEYKMIGCDVGARTWSSESISLTSVSQVIYDFIKENGFKPLNFTIHPGDWAVIAYTGEDANGLPHSSGQPQWRVAYAEPPDLPDSKEEILKGAHERVQRYVIGSRDLKITS
jgi:3-(3-hydroxy-phenyl)propionate hydroxylase